MTAQQRLKRALQRVRLWARPGQMGDDGGISKEQAGSSLDGAAAYLRLSSRRGFQGLPSLIGARIAPL